MTNPSSPFGPEKINPARTDGAPEDEQANDFACMILMPEDSFRAQYARLGGNYSDLASAFGVPFGAVVRRAAMLDLAKIDTPASDRWS